MAVFRVEKNHNYTVMANYHLKDNRLSLKAKGLMSVMLSLPDDWDYTLRGLACICKEGVDAIREAIRELERAGYILRSRERNEKGQMKNTEYVIYEEPQEPETQDDADDEDYAPILGSPTLEKPTLENPTLDHPTLENPVLDHPALENPTQININKTNTEPKKEKNKKNQILIHQILIQSSPHGRRPSGPSTWWSRCGASSATISAMT